MEVSFMSLLSIDVDIFEVLVAAGDTHLGGEDFDNHVIDYLVQQHKKKRAQVFRPTCVS